MANIQLIEYKYNTSNKQYEQGGTFEFSPNPRMAKKTVYKNWRITRGTSTTRPKRKAKYRHHEIFDIILQGSLAESKRRELEYYVRQNAYFEVKNLDMTTPDETASTFNPASLETVNVIVTKADFTQEEGKPDFFNYSLELKRAGLFKSSYY